MELQSRVDELRASGLGLAAVSYDSPDVLAAFTEQYGITFPLLADVGSGTIRQYGLLNTVADAAMEPGAGDLSDDPFLAAEFARLTRPPMVVPVLMRELHSY